MKQPKFIIYDGKIIVGKVFYHEDLLPDNYDMKKVSGGGYYELNIKEEKIRFVGKSEKFGRFADNILSLEFEDKRLNTFTKEIFSGTELEEVELLQKLSLLWR